MYLNCLILYSLYFKYKMNISKLFAQTTYTDKLTSLTLLRFISFIIWYIPIFITLHILLTLISALPLVNVLFQFTLSLSTLFKLYILVIISNYLVMLLIQTSQSVLSAFERVVKLFLNPTHDIFISMLLLPIYYIYFSFIKRMFPLIQDEFHSNTNYDDSTCSLLIACLYLIEMLCNSNVYMWLNSCNVLLNINRIDNIKMILKRIFNYKSKRIFCYELKFIIIILTTLITNGNFNLHLIISYILSVIIMDINNTLSLQIMKAFVFAPMNYQCYEVPSAQKLMMFRVDKVYGRDKYYIMLHYFRNVNEELLQYNTNNSGDSSNKQFELNNDVCDALLHNVNYIREAIQDKFKVVTRNNAANQLKVPFGVYFDFAYNEIFEDVTSLQLLNVVSDVVLNVVTGLLKLYSVNNNETQYKPRINRFLEVVINLGKAVSNCAGSDSFYAKMVDSYELQVQLNILDQKYLHVIQKINVLAMNYNYKLDDISYFEKRKLGSIY